MYTTSSQDHMPLTYALRTYPVAKIYIVSGEGDQGNAELYTGARTVRAIRGRITRETVSGDRWARAEIDTGDPAAEPSCTIGYVIDEDQ